MTKPSRAAKAYIDKVFALMDECPPDVKVAVVSLAESDPGLNLAWSCCEKCAYNMLDEAKDYVYTLVEAIESEQPSSVN